jgi:ribosomal protein S18 acetylase RimI-like enzyme
VATFEGGLDIPEAMTDRTLGEVLAGYAYRQSPPFPWRLVRKESGEAVGVLLLSAEGELVYCGVVPGARRQGYGRAMVREAIRIARNIGVKELSLTVDTRNTPAFTLYDREGFRLIRLHDVYLWHAGGAVLQPLANVPIVGISPGSPAGSG